MALELVRKRERSSLISLLFCLIFYPLLYRWSYPLLAAVTAGLGLVILGLLFCVSLTAGAIRRLVWLRRLHRQLSAGETLDHPKDWRQTALRYRTGRIACLLLGAVFLVSLLRFFGDDRELPLRSYSDPLPCATMADMGTDFVLQDPWYADSTITVYSGPLTSAALSLRQYGSVTLADGRRIRGVLYLDYYEMRSSALAKELAAEQQRSDRQKARRSAYAPVELPSLPVDSAAAYTTDDVFLPTIILKKGNQVLHISFLQLELGDDEPLSVEELAAFFAETLSA